MSTPLQFWYEFASSYSYIAALRISRAAEEAGVAVCWRPFLLGPILAAQGLKDSPFNIYPDKGRYMWRDVQRVCEQEGIPFQRPSQFPRNSLLAARVATAAGAEGWRAEFSRAVFRANFAQDRDISFWETIAEILGAIGRDADSCYEQAMSPNNKELLRHQTEEAQAKGIFGAPSFVIGEELFWGNDRLQDALAWAAKS